MLPRAATDHFDTQTGQLNVVLRGVRAVWRMMVGRNWEQAWRSDVGPRMVDLVSTAQVTAAAGSDAYMAAVLTELGLPAESPSMLNIPAFAGVGGDGRSLESHLYGSVIVAAHAQYQPNVSGLSRTALEEYALGEAEAYLEEITATIMADVARAAEISAIADRPWVDGFVRMIEPGACSRCVVLAGKFYLYNDGFLRHPRCRCTHIPYAENMAHDVLTNPNDYFDSLSPAEQDKAFTAAGAEAIRLGANISQVVNARRGMHTAQINGRGWIPRGRMTPVDAFGRKVYVTTEGITKRGVGRVAMGKDRPFRLMPESIIALARDREDAIRLLRLYGYLLGG